MYQLKGTVDVDLLLTACQALLMYRKHVTADMVRVELNNMTMDLYDHRAVATAMKQSAFLKPGTIPNTYEFIEHYKEQ